jgi:hypothetical protein
MPFNESVTKRILAFIIAAVAAAALSGSALAGKTAQLFPGGTYLNQTTSTGLSCLGGSAAATGTTTFVITVPSAQSGSGATLHIDYTFDPDDPALPSYSGGDNFRVQAAQNGVLPITVTIPLRGDDGSSATVVNSTALSIDDSGVLFFDSFAVTAWSCAAEPGATGGVGSGGGSGPVQGSAGCADYQGLIFALATSQSLSFSAKVELGRKLAESLRECLKRHYKEARHKLDEFVKEAGKPKYDAAAAGTLIGMALQLRDALPLK